MNYKFKYEPNHCWYAIRVTYGREMKLMSHLTSCGVASFVPMQYKSVVRKNKEINILTPAIRNLIFIYSTRQFLDATKNALESIIPMRYIMDRASNVPLIVPNEQMNYFIAVAGTHEEQLIYLDNSKISLTRGCRVRITAGVFAGVEGTILRIKGDKRVVVSIDGVMAVATTFIHSSLLTKL